MSATHTNQRISARIPPKVYEMLTQAADLSGATLNQFIVQSAYEKAQKIIEKESFVRMTTRSAAVFFEALENPPKPEIKLKNSVNRYRDSCNDFEN